MRKWARYTHGFAPEFFRMPQLDSQLTHIWHQNPCLDVLLTQRSIQRRHCAKLPNLAKTPLFQPRQDRPQYDKIVVVGCGLGGL